MKKPGIIDRLKIAATAFFRSNIQEPPPWLLSMLGAPTSAAGVDVIPETAITLSTVWACVNILSQTIGSMPLVVYNKQIINGRVVKSRAYNHPLWNVLHVSPNPEMTAMIWRMAVMTHLGLWGNHYSQIVRDGFGRIIQLWPIHPARVRMMRDLKTQQIYYLIAPMFGDQEVTKLPGDEILHIKGLSFTGLVGLSPIGAAREAIGLGLATQEYGSRVFSNDATPGGVLETPNALSDQAYKRLKKSIEDQTRSLSNKHRMIILEEGMKWEQMSLPPEDAQFLATRTFQVSDVARFYRMPLYKLSTDIQMGKTVEQLAIEFISDTIMPWAVNIEQEMVLKLLEPEERASITALFDFDEQLRGDLQTRYTAYSIGRQWGWLSANDILAKENLNPIPGGDEYMVPLNMAPVDENGNPKSPVWPKLPTPPPPRKKEGEPTNA